MHDGDADHMRIFLYNYCTSQEKMPMCPFFLACCLAAHQCKRTGEDNMLLVVVPNHDDVVYLFAG